VKGIRGCFCPPPSEHFSVAGEIGKYKIGGRFIYVRLIEKHTK